MIRYEQEWDCTGCGLTVWITYLDLVESLQHDWRLPRCPNCDRRCNLHLTGKQRVNVDVNITITE